MNLLEILRCIDGVAWTSLFASYAIFYFTIPATIKWVCYVIEMNSITFMLKVPLFLTLPLVIIFGIIVVNLIMFRLAYLAVIKIVRFMRKIFGMQG